MNTSAPFTPTNRKLRRMAQQKRGIYKHATPEQMPAVLAKAKGPQGLEVFDALNGSRPFEPHETVWVKLAVREAFDDLLKGTCTPNQFTTLGHALNIAMVRAESIDPALVEILAPAIEAMRRVKSRVAQGKGYGLDGPGRKDIPPALDVYEAILDASSPMQMCQAADVVQRRLKEAA